eukprot:1366453-Pleurochrysis_carterae.AAC.2
MASLMTCPFEWVFALARSRRRRRWRRWSSARRCSARPTSRRCCSRRARRCRRRRRSSGRCRRCATCAAAVDALAAENAAPRARVPRVIRVVRSFRVLQAHRAQGVRRFGIGAWPSLIELTAVKAQKNGASCLRRRRCARVARKRPSRCCRAAAPRGAAEADHTLDATAREPKLVHMGTQPKIVRPSPLRRAKQEHQQEPQ